MGEIKGRKKHTVTGEVSQIKKQGSGLGMKQVGEKKSPLAEMISKLLSNKKGK